VTGPTPRPAGARARGPRATAVRSAPRVAAAVDIGSNSVHLLVAVAAGHRLRPLVDESVFLGLGDAVGSIGLFGSAKRAELAAALVRYADTARRLGATAITFVGTEPVRRATDAARAAAEVERASGVPLLVLDHTEEAVLTLLGVTDGRPVAGELVVVDVGGGSSEFVAVGPDRAPVAVGLRLGSASLAAAHVEHDPPTRDEVDRMLAAARAAVAAAPPARPRDLVAVGGTASNLVRVLPAAALDRTLTRRRVAEALAVLLTEPAAVAAERHAVNPIRARLLPAGAAIVAAVLEHYRIDRLRVSEAGIREGTVLATLHDPIGWRDRLPVLARGWVV
jgi:exopolyphosphatase/pppGpp-phosphohydrolase